MPSAFAVAFAHHVQLDVEARVQSTRFNRNTLGDVPAYVRSDRGSEVDHLTELNVVAVVAVTYVVGIGAGGAVWTVRDVDV